MSDSVLIAVILYLVGVAFTLRPMARWLKARPMRDDELDRINTTNWSPDNVRALTAVLLAAIWPVTAWRLRNPPRE
jgi:hypothetical protein